MAVVGLRRPRRCRHGPPRRSPRTAHRAVAPDPRSAPRPRRISAGGASRSCSPVIISTGMVSRAKVKPFQRVGETDQRIAVGRGGNGGHGGQQLAPHRLGALGPRQHLDHGGRKIGGHLARVQRHFAADAGRPRAPPARLRTCRCSRPTAPAPPASPDGAWRKRWRSTTRRTAPPAPAAARPAPRATRRISAQ